MMKNRTARVRFAALAVALVLNGGLLTVAAHAEEMLPPPGLDAPPSGDLMAPPMDAPGGDAMLPPPGDAMAPPPGDAMAPPPGDAMAPPPGMDAGLPPVDAMAPPPGMDAVPVAPGGELPPPPGGDALAAPPSLEGELPPPGGEMMTPPAPEAQAPVVEAPAEPAAKKSSYAVKRGDSLWKISGKSSVYADSFQWPLIFIGNRDKIKDPDIIKPNWNLKINRNVANDEAQSAIGKAKETPRYVPHTTARKRLPIEY
jgi:nucleoid-associated protein YgaU